ncbi:MAG: gluconolactonase [Verrucomicrobiales bacterium]|jgi:gluconolactonase
MHRRHFLLLLTFGFLSGPGLLAQESYPAHPDSEVKEGVPQGEVKGPFSWESQIYPGTVRDYLIYVPAAYDPDKAACSLIIQDGLNRAKGWKLPTLMDNLIHEKAMPVTIGIFIDHGRVLPTNGEASQPRFNRSFEYDGMGDRYARLLLEKILPAVSKDYHLSVDPNDRAIGGASSGAIAAFTAAWERPNAFRRVISTIGTYVGLRGGNEYPTLIRKTENKPIRIFLQDGSNDLDIYGGSWWVANQGMLSALRFSGYDVSHRWGEGGHSGKHAAAIMPDVMRWIWRDYPKPIEPGIPPARRTQLVIEGEN